MTTTEPAYAALGTRRRMKTPDDAPAAEPTWPDEPARDGFTALTDPPASAPGLPAPWDGKPVLLTDGDRTETGHWRWTRAFHGGRFRERGLWAKHLTGVPLGFEPVAWRRLDE